MCNNCYMDFIELEFSSSKNIVIVSKCEKYKNPGRLKKEFFL